MQNSKAYLDMLGMIERSHITKSAYSELSFMLGLFSGDMTVYEEQELREKLTTKFQSIA